MLSSPDWGGGPAINTNHYHYLVFNGGADGSVQATQEGTGLAHQGVASQAFYALDCTGCTFENLMIRNLYVHDPTHVISGDITSGSATISNVSSLADVYVGESIGDKASFSDATTISGISSGPCPSACSITVNVAPSATITGDSLSVADATVDQTLDNAIVFSGSHVTIMHNTIHDVGWALFSRWTDGDYEDRIHNNDIYRVDHGFTATATGTVGPMFFYQNHIDNFANWDAIRGGGELPYHHDGLHCFGPLGGPAPTYRGFYIYDNRFGGSVGRQGPTAQIFMEGGSGSDATPCASSRSNVEIFNNVITSSDYVTPNPYLTTSGIAGGVYNNTVIGVNKTVNAGGCVGYADEQRGAKIAFENNLLSTCNTLIGQSGLPDGAFTAGSPDYNVYADSGSNAFACDQRWYSMRQFGGWKRCVHGDQRSRAVRNARLKSSGVPKPASDVSGAGTNLTSLCTGPMVPLCSDIAGTERPRSGAWTAGAY